MNIEDFMYKYNVTDVSGLKSEIPYSGSGGSQDSISNVSLLDFIAAAQEPHCCTGADQNQIVENLHLPEKLTEYGGPYKFEVSFEPQENVTKSGAWTYSELVKMLYANINQPCPVRMRLTPSTPPGTIVRCFLRYVKLDQHDRPVVQCANHKASEQNQHLAGYVLRCRHASVRYETHAESGQHCLYLPLERIPESDWKVNIFEFRCLNTCLGRLPMEMIFQVECRGKTIAYDAVNVRVCSCPGRDRKHDEKLRQDRSSKQKSRLERSGIPTKRLHSTSSTTDDEVYTIQVKGHRNYDLMMQLKQRLELADAYECERDHDKQHSLSQDKKNSQNKQPSQDKQQKFFSVLSTDDDDFQHCHPPSGTGKVLRMRSTPSPHSSYVKTVNHY